VARGHRPHRRRAARRPTDGCDARTRGGFHHAPRTRMKQSRAKNMTRGSAHRTHPPDTLRKLAPARRDHGVLRAEALAVVADDHVRVRPRRAPTEEVLRAEIAAVGYVPAAGDRVLVEQGDDAWFVVGALGEARRRTSGRVEVREGD